jgi:hypothetical protein
MSNAISYPEENKIGISLSTDCSGKNFDFTNSVITLSIVSGSEYGYFSNYYGDSLGTVIDVTYSTFNEIRFKPNCNKPQAATSVVIMATSDDIISTTSFILQPPEQLRLDFSETFTDTYYGCEELLQVFTRNQVNNIITPAPNGCVTYRFEILEGQEWGTLHYYGNDNSGDTIDGVWVGYGGDGSVTFRVWEGEPTNTRHVKVRVSASDPAITPDTMAFDIFHSQLKMIATPSRVSYGDSSHIVVYKQLAGGTLVPLPTNAEVYFELYPGDDAGVLSSPDGAQQDDDINGIFQEVWFHAIEETPQPDSVEVWINAVTIDGETGETLSGYVKVIVINEQTCVHITLNPSILSPGDTCNLGLMKKKPDGTLEDFLPEQLFNAQIVEGAEFGTLFSSDGSQFADELTAVTQVFKFVAADSLGVDTANIKIAVETVSSGAKTNTSITKSYSLVCEYGEVTIIKEDCILTPCHQSTINIEFSEKAVNSPSNCSERDGGVTYSVVKNISYNVCGTSNLDCEAKLNVSNINVDIEYGLCETNLTNYTSLPTDAEYIKNHSAVCKIKRDFTEKYKKLMQHEKDRPRTDIGGIILTTWIADEQYILKDAMWDHEKFQVPQVKAQLQTAVNKFIDWINNEKCLTKSTACKIKNDDQAEYWTQWHLIEVQLKEYYEMYFNTQKYIDDELDAQKHQAKKYERILKDLETVECN